MNTKHTPLPICPHCGAECGDAWEINFGPGLEGDTEVSCGHCGKDYRVSREVVVTYSTAAIRALKEKP